MPAMNEDLASPPPYVVGDGLQALPYRVRGSCNGLADIDTPVLVASVGDVDPDPRQPTGLLTRPCAPLAEPKPPTREQKPFLPVDVEALLAGPSVWSTGALEIASFVKRSR